MSHEYDAVPIPGPYWPAARLVLGGLIGLFLLPTLAAALLIWREATTWHWFWLLVVGAGLFILWCLVLVTVWVLDHVQIARIRAFLNSNRPLIRWQYTRQEWAAIKEARWHEEKSDWQVQLGCLTAIFALIGTMVAGLVGLEDGMEEALVGGALGALAGALIGAAIGAVVAGGNHLTARLARREPTAPLVALAPHEIYANGQYFRGNGSYRYIEDTHLDAGPPVILTVNIWSPKIRGISAEEWEIVVPDDRADEVEEIRAQLAAGHGSDS